MDKTKDQIKMAAIDKIYGNQEQWEQLHDFILNKKPELYCFLFEKTNGTNSALCCFGYEDSMWLLKNCPLKFVIDRIKEQYGIDA